MSTYSWKFYSSRRGVSLKRLVEEREMTSYEDLELWCRKNRVTPPSREVFDQEVGAMLKKPAQQKAPAPTKPAPKKAQPASDTKVVKKSPAPKRSSRATKKSGTKSK